MNKQFYIRWRGKESGPFSSGQIRRALKDNKIGLLHEIKVGNNWVSVRDFLDTNPGGMANNPAVSHGQIPHVSSGAAVNVQSLAQPNRVLNIRWRGEVEGPYTIAQIEQMLDRQEIGHLHEIECNNQWISLAGYFRNVAITEKQRAAVRVASAHPPEASYSTSVDGIQVTVRQLRKEVPDSGGTKRLLDDINFSIRPGEFVAILGPSGSGKSTLMDAINGRRPATSGEVLYNGSDLQKEFSRFRRTIAYVPQKDIVHLPLSVEQELMYAARLRLSDTMDPKEIHERVTDVAERLGLTESLSVCNANLSGGQLKRVSVGAEIVADPQILFLDEATSGLDTCTEARLMHLFRRLASEGRTVVCITHNLENILLCDSAIILHEGRLAYHGPPDEIASYFGVEHVGQIYEKLESRLSVEWATEFAQIQRKTPPKIPAPGSNLPTPEAPERSGFQECLRQFGILFSRYATITCRDARNLSLLLLQAPVIAVLLVMVFGNEETDPVNTMRNQTVLVFLMAITAIWFGCINAAREIAKELPIYTRERMIGLRIDAYFYSKASVLLLLSLIQCGILTGIVHYWTPFDFDWKWQLAILVATSASGVAIGLFISALVSSADKAIAIVPIILIPQVIFGNAVKELSGQTAVFAQWTTTSYWAYDALRHTLPYNQSLHTFKEDLTKILLFAGCFAFATCFALKRKDN